MTGLINSLLFEIAAWAEDGYLTGPIAQAIYRFTELLP